MKLGIIGKILGHRPRPEKRLIAVTSERTGDHSLSGVESFLNTIGVPEPFSLELAGDSAGVALLARCREGSFVKQQVGAFYPQARVSEVSPEDDPLRLAEGERAWSTTLRLRGPEYLPLRTFRDDDLKEPGSDPLVSLIGAMSGLGEGERLVARSKVGRRRVTPCYRSTFPSAPFRTGRAAFTASGSPVVYVCFRGLIRPWWMSMWHVRQTARVLRFRAAMSCTHLGFSRWPFTFRSRSARMW